MDEESCSQPKQMSIPTGREGGGISSVIWFFFFGGGGFSLAKNVLLIHLRSRGNGANKMFRQLWWAAYTIIHRLTIRRPAMLQTRS